MLGASSSFVDREVLLRMSIMSMGDRRTSSLSWSIAWGLRQKQMNGASDYYVIDVRIHHMLHFTQRSCLEMFPCHNHNWKALQAEWVFHYFIQQCHRTWRNWSPQTDNSLVSIHPILSRFIVFWASQIFSQLFERSKKDPDSVRHIFYVLSHETNWSGICTS